MGLSVVSLHRRGGAQFSAPLLALALAVRGAGPGPSLSGRLASRCPAPPHPAASCIARPSAFPLPKCRAACLLFVLVLFSFPFQPHRCRFREVLALGTGFVPVKLWVPSSGIIPLTRWPTGLGDRPLPPPSPRRCLA